MKTSGTIGFFLMVLCSGCFLGGGASTSGDTLNLGDSGNLARLDWGWIPSGEPVVCPGETVPGTGGLQYPFTGVVSGEVGFSCTRCPTGKNELQGTWVFFNERPSNTISKEVIRFDGNTYVETISAVDSVLSPNEEMTAVLKGYYFCPMDSEMPPMLDHTQTVFVITSVEPIDGAFGNHVGDVYGCYTWFSADGNTGNMLLWCDFEWTGNPAPQDQRTYCRVGTTIEGEECVLP
ncbi:MAG: hypothetical protein CMH54_07250 [Myxococcales bacterium]|nr:hypothetical protein [Myxococcales bacterium]